MVPILYIKAFCDISEIQRGMNTNGRCKLCFEEQEARGHLFFGCRFSKVIWEGILQLCQLQRQAGNWQHELYVGNEEIKMKAWITILLKLDGMLVFTGSGRNEIMDILQQFK